MCGIVGIYNFDGSPVDAQLLARMTRVLHHRGPDDSGLRLFTFLGSEAVSSEVGKGGLAVSSANLEGGLGFTRLSILDLSMAGHQPMCDPDGTVILVFNGEIYNAFSLKPELERRGYRFRGHSDTEVLLYLYLEHGLEGALARLNGMFAFAVCDLRQRRLFLARDRMGIKPLYVYRGNRHLLFASEVKAFFAHPGFSATLDQDNLAEYLTFRYCAGDRHLLKGVRSLGAGRVMEIGPGHESSRPYWQLRSGDTRRAPLERDVLDGQLEGSLRASVTRQLVSDVEVGCQLSGGVDSSLVAMMAAESLPERFHAISITLGDPRFSEAPFVDQVTRRLPIDCHRFKLSAEFFSANIENATWSLDLPLNHPNSLGIYLLAKRAKDWMTVMLSGEGADELLGGYSRYAFAATDLRAVGRAGAPPMQWAPASVRHRFAVRFGWDPGLDRSGRFIASSAFMPPDVLGRVLPGGRFLQQVDRRRELFRDEGQDFLKDCLAYDLRTYLVDLLVRQDKMTMAHSIENRVPFLDNQMLDLWAELPSSSLVRGSVIRERFSTKIPLKRIAARYFGSEFAYRKKMGFAVPLREFLQEQVLGVLMSERILPGIERRGLVRAEMVKGWWKALPSLSHVELESLWICVAFELWAEVFLDGVGASRYLPAA